MANVLPVDVEIPGCPPTPTALLEGILAAVTAAAGAAAAPATDAPAAGAPAPGDTGDRA